MTLFPAVKFIVFLAAMLLAGKVFWLGEAAIELRHFQAGLLWMLIAVWFIWLVKNRR